MNEKSSGSMSRKQRLTAVGTRCADHVTPLYPQELALTSPTGGGRSVGIVRVRTKATELYPPGPRKEPRYTILFLSESLNKLIPSRFPNGAPREGETHLQGILHLC